MKSFILTLVLLIPTLVLSQINSGGHPDGDGGPRDIPEDVFFQLLLRHNKIIERSATQWNQCFKQTQIKFQSLNEIYLQMIWRDLKTKSNISHCEINPSSKNDVECFFQDDVLRRELKHLLGSKYIKSFLKFREGDESSEELIKYFESKIKPAE